MDGLSGGLMDGWITGMLALGMDGLMGGWKSGLMIDGQKSRSMK